MGSTREWNYPARMVDRRLISLFAILPLCGSCGDEAAPVAPKPTPQPNAPAQPAPPSGQPEAPESAPAVVAESEPATKLTPWVGKIDPEVVGTVKGVVRFEGTAPKRIPIAITVTGCNAHAEPPLSETVIVENGRLANVFVTITRGLEKVELPPASSAPVRLEQDGCVYRPHVIGMRTGQTLLIANADKVTHNVNVRESKNAIFNQVQAAGSPALEWKPQKRELGVGFGCDLHPWMKAWICVEEHPFWAITGKDGTFSMQGLPPGPYTIEAWHEKYGKESKKITLLARGEAVLDLVFEP
jgi:plastocyanin